MMAPVVRNDGDGDWPSPSARNPPEASAERRASSLNVWKTQLHDAGRLFGGSQVSRASLLVFLLRSILGLVELLFCCGLLRGIRDLHDRRLDFRDAGGAIGHCGDGEDTHECRGHY